MRGWADFCASGAVLLTQLAQMACKFVDALWVPLSSHSSSLPRDHISSAAWAGELEIGVEFQSAYQQELDISYKIIGALWMSGHFQNCPAEIHQRCNKQEYLNRKMLLIFQQSCKILLLKSFQVNSYHCDMTLGWAPFALRHLSHADYIFNI